uniref:Uncharacterized protein n=1 Tax=Odontella aurita TaxID=265563 RepID=A0A6U6D3Z6_9STRA|mmetsp:Transcript_18445/g.53182  ORF Transcript_18445/g.53182 Transcript_18445/m.53182 type:complete len:148 (+) Transcript_18445:495-938(+)
MEENLTLEEVFLVKFYSQFDPDVNKQWKEPVSGLYARNFTHETSLYKMNRAIEFVEARDAGIWSRNTAYQVKKAGQRYGIVAEAIPSVGLNRIIAHLQEKDSRDGQTIGISLGSLQIAKDRKRVSLGVIPSLVNHLGFYSDQYKGRW